MTYLRRKIDAFLEQWKSDSGKKPLIVKGSRQVVESFQRNIADNGLKDCVELGGTFCMGNCQQGVCVTVDGELFSVSPETSRPSETFIISASPPLAVRSSKVHSFLSAS